MQDLTRATRDLAAPRGGIEQVVDRSIPVRDLANAAAHRKVYEKSFSDCPLRTTRAVWAHAEWF